MDGASNRGLLYADEASIVLRSLRGLGRMIAAFVEVFGTFGLSISESKMETMCMSISRASATKIVFNATGQQYGQTTSFTYLEGTVTETQNLSDEIDRRIRAGWMSFKSYMRELYDRPKACLLPLKTRMVRYEVVEALLYGCATWTPLEGHYTKLRSNTPFYVASNPRSLVQVAKQAYPLLQRHPPANRM